MPPKKHQPVEPDSGQDEGRDSSGLPTIDELSPIGLENVRLSRHKYAITSGAERVIILDPPPPLEEND